MDDEQRLLRIWNELGHLVVHSEELVQTLQLLKKNGDQSVIVYSLPYGWGIAKLY